MLTLTPPPPDAVTVNLFGGLGNGEGGGHSSLKELALVTCWSRAEPVSDPGILAGVCTEPLAGEWDLPCRRGKSPTPQVPAGHWEGTMAEPDPLGCPSQRGLARNPGCLWTCPGMSDRPGVNHKAGAGETPLLPVGPGSTDGLHCAGRGHQRGARGRLPPGLTRSRDLPVQNEAEVAPQAVHAAPCPKPSSPGLCPGTGASCLPRGSAPRFPQEALISKRPARVRAGFSPSKPHGPLFAPCLLGSLFSPLPVSLQDLGFQHRTHKPVEATR